MKAFLIENYNRNNRLHKFIESHSFMKEENSKYLQNQIEKMYQS